jgi:hypothetical protein
MVFSLHAGTIRMVLHCCVYRIICAQLSEYFTLTPVPIANGYELRQGLLDVGVHCEMAVYTGYGHGITKPKSQRAVLSHNKDWFGEHYLDAPHCIRVQTSSAPASGD